MGNLKKKFLKKWETLLHRPYNQVIEYIIICYNIIIL